MVTWESARRTRSRHDSPAACRRHPEPRPRGEDDSRFQRFHPQIARARESCLDVIKALENRLDLIGVDDLHPTPQGYDLIAATFFETIRATLEEPVQRHPPDVAFHSGNPTIS